MLSVTGLKNVMQTVKQFQALIEQLPTPNKLLLSWTIVHMTHVIASVSRHVRERASEWVTERVAEGRVVVEIQ